MEQDEKTKTAIGLSAIFGVAVVDKKQYDNLRKEKEKLLSQVRDVPALRKQVMGLQVYVKYHSEWNSHTKNIESKINILYEKGYVNYNEDCPEYIIELLKEAYSCYTQSLWLSCYGMILRVLEATVIEAYNLRNTKVVSEKTTLQKLEWLRRKKLVTMPDCATVKAMLEIQSHYAHEMTKPTELQIFSGFEAVIKFLRILEN